MPALEPSGSLDLQTLRQQFDAGALQPRELLQQVVARIDAYPDPAVWILRLGLDQIDTQLGAALKRRDSGAAQPLLGIPFAVKDNIDVAGLATTAGCPAFSYVAQRTATIVQKLLRAGAILVGKTNMDQFAAGLVGTRSPYGACGNAFDSRYISGGSSSGSAVAVAAGLVSFTLGTDTAGSGRVPAAFNNIVGLKPTRGLLSNAGVVPACRSIDCVSIFALSCDDARDILSVTRGHDPQDPFSRRLDEPSSGKPVPRSRFRFGILQSQDREFFGNTEASELYAAAIQRLAALGGQPVEIDYAPFKRAAALLYGGPWVAERYLVVRELLTRQPEAILPVTRSILERGASITGADAFSAIYELQALRNQVACEWERADVLLLPTTGTIYTIAEVESEPIALNTNLGYYTNFVNLLDCCAVSVPGGMQSNGLPFGVSLIAPAGQDRALLEIGDELHRTLGIGPGVARHPLRPSRSEPAAKERKINLAVVGAHLSGMPLNHQLTDRGATLVRAARTAPVYRLYALPNTAPPKPGLIRLTDRAGASIELEIWEMSADAFGTFVAAIPAPLGIGMIQLEDGGQVQGFLCEACALTGARDITEFGGWRAFMAAK